VTGELTRPGGLHTLILVQ